MTIAKFANVFNEFASASERNSRLYFSDMLFVAGLVTFFWCWLWGKSSWMDMASPVVYSGDVVYEFAHIKAFASGQAMPFLFKSIPTLNAPFQANWNDFPFPDLIYFPAGALSAIFNLTIGASLYLLLMQVIAGLSFYVSGRLLSYRRDFVLAGAVLFALSPFAFYRNLAHLNLSVYWHIPLLLLAVTWCDNPLRLKLQHKHTALVMVMLAFVAGLYNPYYLSAFLVLLAFILCGHVINRSRRNIILTGGMLIAAILGFLLSNADTLLFALFEGGNPAAVQRELWGLTVYGLRLPDLIFPMNHRLDLLQELGQKVKVEMYPEYLRGEAQTAYIGLVSIIGLVWLLVKNTINVAAKRFGQIPIWYWMALCIIAFGIVGGLNYLLGSFGFVLLRATNRFSIVLMAIALFFLCEKLPKTRIGKPVFFLPFLMLALGLFDQIPQRASAGYVKSMLAAVDRDRNVAYQLEKELPGSAMVFQLPVKAFPETFSVHNMQDYDQFRPWLYTKNLRFSYGTVKGRGDADWQLIVESLSVPDMIKQLEQYGFAAVLVNKKAYKDGAQELDAQMQSGGCKKILNDGDFIAFRLNPSSKPQLPELEPYQFDYNSGFYWKEGSGSNTGRWAKADAKLAVLPSYLPEGYPRSNPSGQIEISFDIAALGTRSVLMELDGSKTMVIKEGQTVNAVKIALPVRRLPATIHFTTDRPAQLIGNGDSRSVAFRLSNIKIVQLP